MVGALSTHIFILWSWWSRPPRSSYRIQSKLSTSATTSQKIYIKLNSPGLAPGSAMGTEMRCGVACSWLPSSARTYCTPSPRPPTMPTTCNIHLKLYSTDILDKKIGRQCLLAECLQNKNKSRHLNKSFLNIRFDMAMQQKIIIENMIPRNDTFTTLAHNWQYLLDWRH